MNVLQRPDWHGSPVDLGELFVLRKNRREAVCKLLSHQFGWECRLYIGQPENIVQTQVCRSQQEGLTLGEAWRTALEVKGWRKGGAERIRSDE